jgi:MFS transporter, AAHS family, 4-hydroxybenzoate transporter
MYGWRGVFLVGGILPLIVCIPAAFCLPESPPLLAARKHDPKARLELERILRRIGIATPIDRVVAESTARTVATRIAALLRAPYRARTLLLWAIFTANSFTLYYLSGWLPTLLQAAGLPLPQALRASSFLWMGGILGAVVISWLIDHRRPLLGLLGALLGASAILGSLLVVPVSFGVWGAMIFGLGAAVSGVQFALPGLAALMYPPTILATGNGWAVSIGRLGAVSGPIVGGWLLARAVPPATLLGVLAIPALLAASLVVALFAVWTQRSSGANVDVGALAHN